MTGHVVRVSRLARGMLESIARQTVKAFGQVVSEGSLSDVLQGFATTMPMDSLGFTSCARNREGMAMG